MFSYDDYLRQHKPVGNTDHGELQVRPLSIANPQHGPYGVVFQDQYLTVIRHPVLYPSLAEGSYSQVVQGVPGQEIYGVVVLPLFLREEGDPEVAWVRQWRLTRNGWMTEIPRGGVGSHEPNAHGALREVREETGLGTPDLLLHMGDLVNDSGLSSTACSYYAAVYMRRQQLTARGRESKEAISEVLWAPIKDWMTLAQKPGVEGRPVGGLDAFSMAAHGLASVTGTLTDLNAARDLFYGGGLASHEKLSSALQSQVSSGRDEFRLRVRCRSLPLARALADLVPFFLRTPCDSEEVFLKEVTPIALAWLVGRSEVLGIDSL